MKNSRLSTLLWDYFLMTVGSVIFCMAWTSIIIPSGMSSGGVTGLCTIIQYATNGAVPVGWTYPIINIILLVLGFLTLGKGFGIKTIYVIALTSVLFEVLPRFPMLECHDFVNEKLVGALLGAAMESVGLGLVLLRGGSSGGTDIVALVWCRFHSASPGRVILIIDVVIILSSLLFPSYTETGELLPFTEKLAVVVYGLIQVTVSGYAIDLYLSGSKQSVQAFIFTKKVSEMADAIAFDMKRGVTVIPAKGWYSKEEKNVLMVVTRKTDLNLLLRYVKTIDPDAFLSVSSVMGVYGQGFDSIKVKTKK